MKRHTPQQTNKTHIKDKTFKRLGVALMVISFILIVWQDLGMNLEYRVPASAYLRSLPLNDDINGGKSQSQLETAISQNTLSCQTRPSHTFSFCSVLIPIGDIAEQGVDLRSYEQISVTLSFEENHQLRDTVLIYLLNDEGLPKSYNTFESMRANQAAIIPNLDSQARYQLPLSQFSVPSWWIYNHQQIAHLNTAFDNIQYIQIATGDSYLAKDVRLVIEDIVFTGKWISKFELYRFIVMTFFSYFILYALVVVHRHIRSLTQSAEKLHHEKQSYIKLANYDYLTKILNRRGLEELCCTLDAGASLILFDVDNFKSVNDLYGHDEGDRILVAIAQLSSKILAPNCHIARWGGEEFIVICEGISTEKAQIIAETLREHIEKSLSLVNGHNVTCTFGVAELAQSFDQTVKRADLALFQGKHNGKNCVVLAQI